MDKPVPLAMIRSQADLDEKCTSRKYCMIVLAKPDSNTTSLLSKPIKTRLKRLGKIFRNVRFVVVDLTKFSADFPDWVGTSRPDPVVDESDGGRKLWPVFVNRISKSKRRELEIVDVPPAVNPSSLSLHTDTKIRLSTCRNQIRDVLLRGGTSPLEIANIFELNMLDENVSPVDIASSVDDIVVRSFIDD